MTDINDAPTLACDHCGVPVVMTDLVPFKSEHICRFCWERAHDQPRVVTAADLKAFARFPEGSPVVEDRYHAALCPDCGKVKYNAAARCVSTACNP